MKGCPYERDLVLNNYAETDEDRKYLKDHGLRDYADQRAVERDRMEQLKIQKENNRFFMRRH